VPVSKLLFWVSFDTVDWVLRWFDIVAPWLAGASTPAGRFAIKPCAKAALPVPSGTFYVDWAVQEVNGIAFDMIDLGPGFWRHR
jgi:hypothetical protein